MTRNEEKIYQLCKTASADINLCRVAYSVIEKAPREEQATLLETFVICYKNTPTDHSLKLPQFMDFEEQERIRRKHSSLVDKRMMALLEMELPEKEFYDKLWIYLSTTPFLPNFEARVVALYKCVINKRLPYFLIDRSAALSMDQDTYSALHTQIGEKKLAQMKYILDAEFDQKTQRASLLVSMMDSLKSFEERTVFISRLITHFRTDRLRNLIGTTEGRWRPRFLLDDRDDIFTRQDLPDLFDDDDDPDDVSDDSDA